MDMARQDTTRQDEGRDRERSGERMPTGVKVALFAVLGVIMLGALHLIMARGPAMLLDLAALSRSFLCF
ncbi:MAG: hypothetical protein KDJ41_16725 [Hyphomicrobiaceae bacterium]|nr:hypothetical protein [Hyphomicrobiaceae bacterium]